MEIKAKAEFESRPIRSLAIQCHSCGKWFKVYDLTDEEIHYQHEIEWGNYTCPICWKSFGSGKDEIQIEDSICEEIDKITINKKVSWE